MNSNGSHPTWGIANRADQPETRAQARPNRKARRAAAARGRKNTK